MIKAEFVIEGNVIYCNSFTVYKENFDYTVINREGDVVKDWISLEEAIQYCLEN